jgi:hypothetical protein
MGVRDIPIFFREFVSRHALALQVILQRRCAATTGVSGTVHVRGGWWLFTADFTKS